MSFVKKAVKKVFNVVKKVVKKTVSFTKRLVKNKWFQIVAVVALSVFTAGLASGGFAAFGSAMSAAGGGIGGFFSAVGSTMATGWSAITSSVTSLFGAGAAPAAAPAAATQPLMGWSATQGATGLLGQGIAGSTTGALAATSASGFVAPLASNVAANAASKGILAKFGSLLMDPGLGGTMLRQGVMMGIQAQSQKEYADKMEGYYKNRTVFGGPAFGGTTEPVSYLTPWEGEEQSVAQQLATAVPAPEATQPGILERSQQYAQNVQPLEQQQQQAAGAIPGPTPQQQQGAMAMPQPTQPPPAANPQQNSPQGLLQLETAGVYYG